MDDGQDTEKVTARDGETTGLELHLEQALASLPDQEGLHYALHGLEDAHLDVDCDREVLIDGQQQMDSGC